MGEWFGVETNSEGSVVALVLIGNSLKGDLPLHDIFSVACPTPRECSEMCGSVVLLHIFCTQEFESYNGSRVHCVLCHRRH